MRKLHPQCDKGTKLLAAVNYDLVSGAVSSNHVVTFSETAFEKLTHAVEFVSTAILPRNIKTALESRINDT